MKYLNIGNVNKRADVNLCRSISNADENVKGVMFFGKNNDYFEIMERLILGSKTAKAVSKIYSAFLYGKGFENEAINDIVIGKTLYGQNVTVKDLLKNVCRSVAGSNAFYVHCNFNLDNKITSLKNVPVKHCRFSDIDEVGYSAKIAVCQDWLNKKKNDIKYFNVFNNNEVVLTEEIKTAGGIEKFAGQIYFKFFDSEYLYPLNPFDSVYLDLDTENQISIFKNSTIRNGFQDKLIMCFVEPETEEEEEELSKKLKNLMGADGDPAFIYFNEVDETGELKTTGLTKIEKLESNINADLFEKWETSLANSIRKVMNGMPAILIDYEEGKLSTTSGEAIIQATNFYNSITEQDRNTIESSMKELLSIFDNETLQKNTNWNIVPISIYETAKTNDAKQKRIESQAILRGSVGGVQSILQIQQSVKDGVSSKESAIAIMKEIFGISEKISSEIIGNIEVKEEIEQLNTFDNGITTI